MQQVTDDKAESGLLLVCSCDYSARNFCMVVKI